MKTCLNCAGTIKRGHYHVRDLHMVNKGESPYRYYCSINCFLMLLTRESPEHLKYFPWQLFPNIGVKSANTR